MEYDFIVKVGGKEVPQYKYVARTEKDETGRLVWEFVSEEGIPDWFFSCDGKELYERELFSVWGARDVEGESDLPSEKTPSSWYATVDDFDARHDGGEPKRLTCLPKADAASRTVVFDFA